MHSLGHRLPTCFTLRDALSRHRRISKGGSEIRGQLHDAYSRAKVLAEDSEAKWQDLRLLKRKLTVSINEEDFVSAASLRDSIEVLMESMSAAEQYSLKLMKTLHTSASVEERISTLSRIGDVGDVKVVPDIAALLHDESVCTAAENCMMALLHKNQNPEVNKLMQLGANAMGAAQFARALELFESVTVLDPAFAEGHNKKATTLYLMGNFEESIDVCRLVIDLQPYHFGAMAGMGLCYYRLRQHDRAIQSFEQALFVNPGLSRIRYMAENLKNGNLPNI